MSVQTSRSAREMGSSAKASAASMKGGRSARRSASRAPAARPWSRCGGGGFRSGGDGIFRDPMMGGDDRVVGGSLDPCRRERRGACG